MSYILDALKRSEQERREQAESLASQQPILARRPFPWRAIIGVFLVLNLGLGAMLFLRPGSPPANESAGIGESPSSGQHPSPTDPEIEAVKAEVRDLAAEMQRLTGGARPSAPAARPAAADDATDLPALANESATSVEAAETAVAAATADPRDPPSTPFLRQLPDSFQRTLPPLAVNIHIYATDEGQRILYINNREYRRGEWIQDGLRVEEIVPDGVVLRYQGQAFKLPRPR